MAFPMASLLRWGIIGTGKIAHAFARGLTDSQTGRLVAVGSRAADTSLRFGREHGLDDDACHASYEALLAASDVEAVYISTPHPGHAEWSIKAAEAGKHILCEKPLAMNHAEAMAVVEAAQLHGVFLMEAFMYRCHPQTARLVELVRAGAIGNVGVIQAAFSFRTQGLPTSRLLDPSLGGGGILDVGCYPVSVARLLVGAAQGLPFVDPLDFHAVGKLGDTGVDDHTVAVASFPGGITAQLATGIRLQHDNTLRIYGDAGHFVVPEPFTPAYAGGTSRILLHRSGSATPEEICIETPAAPYSLYTLEADHVAAHLEARQSPAMPWADTLGNMQTLDRWRAAIGLTYPLELATAPDASLTVAKRPLRRRSDAPIPSARVPGLDKPVSRLVMGCDNQRTYPHASALFDRFYELGGNAFDTAWLYHGGLQERLLGQWLRNRGALREEVVIIGKGAHTPACDSANLSAQLLASLERLQTDYVDIYVMHRDNPAIPAGEFVETLNEHHRAGRVRAFGGSNWSIDRVEEANAYAAAHGLQPFTVVSNNLSLARMVEPVWGGCVTASDPASLAWFERHGLALFSWSSQARGFFLEHAPASAVGNHPSAAEIVRCWHSEDNVRRRERAVTLARERGVQPINVALAYVLAQPFPTFALFGPRTLEEIRTSLPGLGLGLSAAEVAWLDLRGER